MRSREGGVPVALPRGARTVLACGLAAGLAVIDPAFAGWDYADWGMSPEEVVAASGGKVARYGPPLGFREGGVIWDDRPSDSRITLYLGHGCSIRYEPLPDPEH